MMDKIDKKVEYYNCFYEKHQNQLIYSANDVYLGKMAIFLRKFLKKSQKTYPPMG